jgi:hypothetical protein
MRVSLAKLTSLACAAVVLAFSMTAMNARAERPAQATAAPTGAATGPAAMRTYPPCPPPVGSTPLPSPTPQPRATGLATVGATPTTPNPTPAYLGVQAEQVQDCGVRVLVVLPGTPAEGQIQAQDVIVAIDDVAVRSLVQLSAAVQARTPGQRAKFTVQRGGQHLDITVTLTARPQDTTVTLPPVTTPAATAGR